MALFSIRTPNRSQYWLSNHNRAQAFDYWNIFQYPFQRYQTRDFSQYPSNRIESDSCYGLCHFTNTEPNDGAYFERSTYEGDFYKISFGDFPYPFDEGYFKGKIIFKSDMTTNYKEIDFTSEESETYYDPEKGIVDLVLGPLLWDLTKNSSSYVPALKWNNDDGEGSRYYMVNKFVYSILYLCTNY